ncbi:MarR family winged helix-turn-helix transcriptional regulator [Nonomuraea polychroma]|uniref:MarR family winged helix-turn-helix transcriptional regulator n=1 Tax=Nonomuraea polychroma TaxID=46176 RepID=UPI003D8A5A96
MWDKEIKDFLADHGLEPGEFDILSTLRRSGEPYELTAKTFLKASLVTTGAVTLRVDRMDEKGLVTRVPDASDRRSVKIRLTPRGLEVIDRVLPLHLANEARLLQSLDADERRHLATTLATMLESHGDTAPPPTPPTPPAERACDVSRWRLMSQWESFSLAELTADLSVRPLSPGTRDCVSPIQAFITRQG